jgi:CBS domain containing-hemolysin-like protein
MELYLFIFFLSLVLSAFFSGIEIAFISSNKLQVELEKKNGTWTGRKVAEFIQNPTRFINTILIGNNISLVLITWSLSMLIEKELTRFIPSEIAILLILTLITTVIILIFGEFMPKVFFRIYANPVLKILILPFTLSYYLLWVIVKIFGLFSRLILRIFGVKLTTNEEHFTPTDLEHFVKAHSISEEQDREINTNLFENALYLKDTKVRECMVPRTEITAIEENASIEELRKIIIDTHHSRILVYRESIENIIGYVHHFTLLLKPGSIKEMLMPLKAVTETTPAQQLMNDFMKEGRSIAYVVDEYGGTAGIITLEDILEEIFGEIDDEYDDDALMVKQIAPNEFHLNGRFEVDRLNEEFNLDIPEGDYETISGFILMHHENIPEKDEVIQIEHFQFTILEVTAKKIEMVKLVVLSDRLET